MAEDFRAKVTAELDTAEAESKLNAFLNEKRKLKVDVEVNQDSAKKMASSIEKGIKDTKIDTSGISKQLAGSFNITDKNVISKLQSQMDKMISSLGKTWNGKDFDFGKASGFYSGMDSMVNTVTKNAKIVEGATGSYDAFFNYFKDQKIYVSDELKKAMGEDTYKELLQNNIGKIVRDASKGISIDSLWGEMRDLFPEHFSDNITNQVDQIVHAFDVLHQARADVGQVTTAQNMTAEQLTGISDSAAEQVVAIAAKLKESLQSNIMGASEAAKTTIDLDVNVNTDKISSDIRSAVENAGNQAEGALKVNMEVNEEQLVSKIREALSSLVTGEEPVKVNLQVNKESLQEDLNLALNEMDLPVHFKIDTEEIESQIRAAVESIQDMEIDLRVNTRDIQNDVDTAVNGATETPEIHVPEVDSSGLAQMQQALNGVNAAGIRGQSVFQSLGGSFREAFSAYSLANMMQDGLYKIVDAGKKAVSTVKEFDDLKTNLAMVTGKDKTYTEDLIQSYNELGQEIGSITSDVAESANTWLRQGRSMADTNQLIKDSMVLSKDAQMSSEDAAQVLTSTLNGFKLGADQASRINDILTSIDLKSASDAGGIGTSLQKVASQANNVGMSLEKTAAIIATIKDVTQGSDETIGTSLKSILSRMNNIKAGKFVDDNGEALNDVEKVLNKIGITMRDNNDQFLDSETIIDSVADKWDTLNKNTQKAVSTALGGTHQANSVIAMLDNYDKVKMLTETAYNSEGTAEKKFQDNYLNSLEAKTNALKASLENLSTSLVSDNMYSGFLDGAKVMADFAANTDILQASLAGLASAGGVYAFQQLINLFREFSNMGQAMDISRMAEISTDSFEQLLGLTQGLSESQTRMVLSSEALTEAQRTAVLVNQGMSQAEAQAAVAAMGLTTANEAAAASTFTLSGAMEGMLATLMANPLILVAAGVTAAVTAYSAYKRSIEEAVSAAKSAGNTWEENTTSITDNISRIQELREALASGTLTEQEAADAKSELLSIQESLSESYGNQVSGIDLINGSLTEQIALLDQVNEKQSQNFLNENKKGIDKAQKEMEKNRHTYLGQFYDNGSEESEAIKKSIKKLQETYGEDVFKLDSSDGITMDIQFNADASTAKDALNDFMTEVSGIEDQFGETDVTEQLANNAASGLTKAKDVLSEYQDIYKQAQEAELLSDDKLYKSGDTEQKASKWISDYAKAVEDYNNAIADGDNSKISEASQKFSELDSTVNDLVKNTGMSSYADQVKEVRDELNDTAIANKNFKDMLTGAKSSQDSAIDSLLKGVDKEKADNLKDALDQYKSVMAEAEELGIDTSQSKFGNIDTNNRQILKWTDENLKAYKSALQSWDDEAQNWDQYAADMKGSFSTVFGSSEEFDGVEIAFSPMLQTDHGAELLSRGTVEKYIQSLIEEAGEGWNNEDLMQLDTKGLDVDGQHIQGLLADVGDTAIKTGEAMHFAGDTGAIADAYSDLKDAASDANVSLDDLLNNSESLSSMADELKSMDLSDTDFRYAFETDGVQEGEDQINALVQAALDAGVISDTSASSVANLASMLAELGVISSSTGSSLDEVAESIGDISERIDKASAALTGIQKAESVLDAQSTGKSISLDDFNSDELADYTSALEYNNGALQLNAEKVRELQKAKAEEQIQTNNSQKAEKQNQYMQNIAQIEQLQDQLRGLTDAKGEEAQAIQSSIDALLSDNDAIVNQCNQLDLLSASLREATGAYQNWLDKQNASESGDMFDDAMGAMEKIDNVTKNSDSEDYGRVGTNSYKAAVDFIVPDTVDSQDAESVSSYMSSIEHYFNHDEDGNRIGLDVQEFCAKATKAGLMELDEASGEYKIAGQKTMEDFAEGLNLSLPMVQSMFGEMEEFGGEFDWADEATKTLGDMAVAAGEAKGRIEEMSGDTDMNIQIDVSDIDNTEDKVKALDNTIAQMQNYKTTLDVDSSQVDDANAVIQYCVTQKQMLEAPAVMSVDTSQVDGELGNALSLLQQFQEAQNSVELQASVGADTSEAQGKVDSLVGKIQGLSPEIKAQLNIDTTSADTITASLQALSPEIMVKAGVDSSAVDAYAAEEKQSSGKVTWDNETGAVDAFAAQVHRSSGIVSWGNETSRVKTHFTATGTVNWTNTTPPTKGAGGANGTAHVSGTAHASGSAQYNHLSGHAQASGNWATKTGGTTLVGELGREIVVNPATGTWHTVGDNGAEFVNIPAGSIVFNHLQSEALLERGFVNGRGTARANGTAMVRGGISAKQANIASKHTTYSGSKSSSNTENVVTQAAKDTSSAAKAVTGAAENVESWEDPWKNAIDWFERFTTKYNNSIDLNAAKAENYSSYTNQNKYLDKELADISKLKGGYQQAQGYYKYQAEAYADMIGLSQDLRNKVQNGEVNIDLLDEDTKSKVEAYQEWYDKINECESELEKLKKKEKEVDQQKLDNITDRFDDLKKVYSTSSSVIESRLKYREENGESQAPGSKYYKDVNSQRKAQEAQAVLLQKEMVAYRAQMEKIRKKYGETSDIYKKAQAGLNDLRDEFYNCKQSAKELSNTMYELKKNAAEYKTAMYQGRSDNLSSFRNFKEATNYKGSKYGNLTINDYAQAAKINDQTILALQNQKKIAMAKLKTLSPGSPEYQKVLDEINGYTQAILDAAKSTAEFKKAAVEIRFKPFDDAIDSLDELIDDCDTLKGMLDSDTFFSDAGDLTAQGAANIALINKGLNAEQQKIADYKAQWENAQQEYNAGNLTEEQLKEYQKQYKDGIKESSQAIYSYNQDMLKMYEDQVSKENDLLKENVDIRQKAKDAKEEYYQFDKTIKSKNKDINAIKAQIAALEGTTNAAAKAKLEQLKADLAEKEEDLEDTKHDHEIDLISKGYDNLTDQADKALDSTLNAVKSNSQMQTAVIEEMLKTTKQKYKDAYAEINQIIADTGLKVSDQFQNNIKDSNLKNEQTDKKKADKTVTGIKDTKVSGSTGVGNTSADKVIRNAATDAQDKTLKKLTLSPKSVVVNVGKTATVKVSFSPSTAVNKNFNCTASAKGIVKITQTADSITLKGLKTGKTVIKVQGAGGYCKAVSLNVSVLKDATKNSKIVNSTAKSKKYSLTTEEKNRVLNMSTGQNANTVKANTKKEAELKKWYKALPSYTGGDAEIEKIKDPLVKHFAKKGKKTSNANIVKAASILGYKDAKNVSKWDTKKKNAMVKKLQTFGFSKGGVIRNLIPATMGTLLGDAIIKNGDTGFIGAKPGETVLTQDFTKLLKPTTAIMQEFTEVMQKAGTPSVKETPARQEATISNDYQFIVNGVDVNNMQELKKTVSQMFDEHDRKLAKEFKKFR